MTWLLSFIARRGPWATLAACLLVLVGCAALFVAGYRRGYQASQDKAAAAALAEARQTVREMDRMAADNARLAIELEATRALSANLFLTFREELPRVSMPILESRPGTDVPRCTVSVGFVRLWNDALTARVPQASGATADAAAPVDSVADDGRTSGLEPADLIANHLDNAEVDYANRLQCDALIRWHRSHD